MIYGAFSKPSRDSKIFDGHLVSPSIGGFGN
jgi:hypothetical protein